MSLPAVGRSSGRAGAGNHRLRRRAGESIAAVRRAPRPCAADVQVLTEKSVRAQEVGQGTDRRRKPAGTA